MFCHPYRFFSALKTVWRSLFPYLAILAGGTGMEKRIISFVRKTPCLYDPRDADYKNKYVKDKNWTELAKELNISVAQVKKRFKNIRDTYVRIKNKYVQQVRSEGATSDPSWIWWKYMTWLEPYLAAPSTEISLKSLDSFPDDEEVVEAADLITTAVPLSVHSESSTLSEPQSLPNSPLHGRKRLKKTTEEVLKEHLLARLDRLKGQKAEKSDDECSRFGIEVAEQCRAVTDEYERQLLMRNIRDVIFTARFGARHAHSKQQPQHQPQHQPQSPYTDSYSTL